MTIRRMCPGDIKAVAELERKCFDNPWSEQVIKDSFENERYIFVVADAAQGDGGGVPSCTPPPSPCAAYGGMYYVGSEGFIANIAVTEQYRRRGIGRQIVEKLIEECRKLRLESLSLEVRVSNYDAIGLYTRLGFTDYGIRPHYYLDGEDARIFLLEVK